ncbi:MAG: hypothetical protein ABS939_25105 [Psychrobacillus sp.]
MNYFEFEEPYYALVKAKDEKMAKEIYIEVVADLDGDEDVIEVTSNYALAMFTLRMSETKELTSINDILAVFEDDESLVLLIDGSLL